MLPCSAQKERMTTRPTNKWKKRRKNTLIAWLKCYWTDRLRDCQGKVAWIVQRDSVNKREIWYHVTGNGVTCKHSCLSQTMISSHKINSSNQTCLRRLISNRFHSLTKIFILLTFIAFTRRPSTNWSKVTGKAESNPKRKWVNKTSDRSSWKLCIGWRRTSKSWKSMSTARTLRWSSN